MQVVNVNGVTSSGGAVTSGVIKGSVIGPALFVFYINYLLSIYADCEIELFADDTKAYKVIGSPHDRGVLQSHLTVICNWADKRLLTLSLDECLHLQLGYADQSISYKLNHHGLKPTTVAKDLGITLQINLKPGLHCTDIAHKAFTRANIIISFLSRDAKNFTYVISVCVRPILEYCTPVWNPSNKYEIDTIENVQRTFARCV